MSQKKLLMLTFRLNEAAADSWNKVVCLAARIFRQLRRSKNFPVPPSSNWCGCGSGMDGWNYFQKVGNDTGYFWYALVNCEEFGIRNKGKLNFDGFCQ